MNHSDLETALNRRKFLSALAASVVAAGAPLPVGFPSNGEIFTFDIEWDEERVVRWFVHVDPADDYITDIDFRRIA